MRSSRWSMQQQQQQQQQEQRQQRGGEVSKVKEATELGIKERCNGVLQKLEDVHNLVRIRTIHADSMISNKLCLYHEWKNLLAFQAVSFRSRAVKVPRFFCFLLLRLLTCFAYSWTKSMPGVPRRRTTSTWRCKRRGRLCKRWR